MEVESVEAHHLHYLHPQQVARQQASPAPVQVVDPLWLGLHREEGGGGGALQEEVGVGLLVRTSRHRLDPDITGRPLCPQLGGEGTLETVSH